MSAPTRSRCGWCGAHYATWQNKCDTCGGRMPPPPGMELGEAPPGLPRALPRSFVYGVRLKNNTATVLGLVLCGFGGILGLMLLLIFPWAALFPAAILLGGMLMLWNGQKHASEVLRAFRHGMVAEGAITAVCQVTEEKMNGVSPWKLAYRFTLEGQQHQGSLTAYDETIRFRKIGQPVWVLYTREDPSINTVYPPFK